MFYYRFGLIAFLYVYIQVFYNIRYNRQKDCFDFKTYFIVFFMQIFLLVYAHFNGIEILGIP